MKAVGLEGEKAKRIKEGGKVKTIVIPAKVKNHRHPREGGDLKQAISYKAGRLESLKAGRRESEKNERRREGK